MLGSTKYMSVFLPHLKLLEGRDHVCFTDPEMIFDPVGVFQVEKGDECSKQKEQSQAKALGHESMVCFEINEKLVRLE